MEERTIVFIERRFGAIERGRERERERRGKEERIFKHSWTKVCAPHLECTESMYFHY